MYTDPDAGAWTVDDSITVRATTTATLVCHVGHIIELCPKKEMFRIYTGWVVAGMTDVEARRDRAIMPLKGKAMRSNKHWMTILLPSNKYASIVFAIAQSAPVPACIWVDRVRGIAPESINDRGPFSIKIGTRGRTIMCRVGQFGFRHFISGTMKLKFAAWAEIVDEWWTHSVALEFATVRAEHRRFSALAQTLRGLKRVSTLFASVCERHGKITNISWAKSKVTA